MIAVEEALVAAGGGVLIGSAASVMLALSGRVAGISGIVGGLIPPRRGDARWRLAFIAGMVLAGIGLAPAIPAAFTTLDRPPWLVVLAGVFVGVGTRVGNGCTSGHGVCGMARFSTRSFAAVGVFLATGFFTATVMGQVLGGV